MISYMKDAKHDIERIKYFYEHGGGYGYSQARHNYYNLASLVGRASRSKHNQSDTFFIQEMYKSAEPMMEEMKMREKEMQKSSPK